MLRITYQKGEKNTNINRTSLLLQRSWKCIGCHTTMQQRAEKKSIFIYSSLSAIQVLLEVVHVIKRSWTSCLFKYFQSHRKRKWQHINPFSFAWFYKEHRGLCLNDPPDSALISIFILSHFRGAHIIRTTAEWNHARQDYSSVLL